MLSRKHYDLTADIFLEVTRIYQDDSDYSMAARDAIKSLAIRMVEMMYAENNSFKKDKWYRAAGLPQLARN